MSCILQREVTDLFVRNFIALFLCLALFGCSGKTKEELYAEALEQVKTNPNGALLLLKSALEKDPNFLDARYQISKTYMAVGKFEQAEKEFQKVLRQDPTRTDVHLELAKVYIGLKQPAKAIEEAKAYLQAKPGSPDGLEAMAIAYASDNNPAQAEKFLLETLKAEPGRVSAKLELAAVYQWQKREQDARRLIDEVIAADPKNTRAYYLLATIEGAQGKVDRTLEIYRKIAEIDPKDSNVLYKSGILLIGREDVAGAEKLAATLAERFPKGADAPRLKGIIQYTKKNYNDALTNLQASLKIRPTIEGYYFLGLSMFHRGDLETALSQFRKILDVSPSYHRARLLSAMILLKQHRIDDSISEVRKILADDPRSALAHNVLGSALLAKGMYEEGMKELQKATELDPKIVDAHLKKGIMHLARGNVREAESDLATAVDVAPDILNTRLLLASFHMRNKNFGKAVNVINQGLTGKPSDAVLYNYLAGLMFTQNKPAEGLDSLAKAKKIDPGFFPAYMNSATYYASRGEHDRALAEYQAILAKDPANIPAMLGSATLLEVKGKDADALSWYRKAADTKNPTAFLALAAYHAKKKEAKKALTVLDEAIEAVPRNTPALEAKGGILLAEKKYKEAQKVFDDLEAINPGQGLPLKIRGYMAAKDYEKAKEQARRVITLNSASAQGYMMLAAVYQTEGKLQQAINEMKTGARLDPKNLPVLIALGNLHVVNKDYAAAMAAYNDALRKNNDYAPALYAQGSLLEKMGKRKEAVAKYQETISKSDKYVPALNNLSYLYSEGYGSPQAALRHALSAYTLEPGNPAVMDTLGYALLKNKRVDEAQKVLEKTVSLMPNNPSVQYHLALVYREKGEKKLAIDTLQKALSLGAFPEAAHAKALVAELKR